MKSQQMKTLLLLLFSALLISPIHAQKEYSAHTFTASNGINLPYRLLTPLHPEANQQYPLVLFMHGAGERGDDNTTQLTHGGGMFENPVNRDKYPAYVIFPQCPDSGYWAYLKRPDSFQPDSMPLLANPTPLIASVKELIDQYTNRPDIDKNRIYIIGLSMGGMATYDLASRYPEIFAAAIPICGTVNPKRLQAARNINFRIYHGDADKVVPVEASRQAYRTLQKMGANVEYFEFPGATHGSWHPAFNQSDFMEWLFMQNKTSSDPSSPSNFD